MGRTQQQTSAQLFTAEGSALICRGHRRVRWKFENTNRIVDVTCLHATCAKPCSASLHCKHKGFYATFTQHRCVITKRTSTERQDAERMALHTSHDDTIKLHRRGTERKTANDKRQSVSSRCTAIKRMSTTHASRRATPGRRKLHQLSNRSTPSRRGRRKSLHRSRTAWR